MKVQYQQEDLFSAPRIHRTKWSLCPHHGVKGWTFDPETRLWVHPDPECRLPRHLRAQEIEMPKLTPAAPEPEAPPPYEPVEDEPSGLPWWEDRRWPTKPVLIAVDPGDVHCGVSWFQIDMPTRVGSKVIQTAEMTPDEFTDMLAWFVIRGKVKVVVYERFRLYADKAEEQTGSEFATSQLIGVIRWMVRKQNEHAQLHVQWRSTNVRLTCVDDGGCEPGRLPQPVALVGQMADVKKPARGILRRKGLASWTKQNRVDVHAGKKVCAEGRCHAIDSELHGWYWLLRGSPRAIEERPRVDSRHLQALV